LTQPRLEDAWRVKDELPELERFCAKRMGATTYEADSSHVPMLSNPRLVIDVIRTAAKSYQGSPAAAGAPQ
jgi:hypothetical protein